MNKLREIIKNLEQTRKDKNLSYEEVAKLINSSRSNVWKCLTGLSIPNSETLLLLIDCLGFTFEIKNKLTLNDIERGDLPDKIHKEFINKKLKQIKPKAVKKENVSKIFEVSKECPNCKYSETASGLKIKILKCNDCKTKKK